MTTFTGTLTLSGNNIISLPPLSGSSSGTLTLSGGSLEFGGTAGLIKTGAGTLTINCSLFFNGTLDTGGSTLVIQPFNLNSGTGISFPTHLVGGNIQTQLSIVHFNVPEEELTSGVVIHSGFNPDGGLVLNQGGTFSGGIINLSGSQGDPSLRLIGNPTASA